MGNCKTTCGRPSVHAVGALHAPAHRRLQDRPEFLEHRDQPLDAGAGIGLLGAGMGGFVFGWLLARMINGLIGWEELLLRRQIVSTTIDPLEASPQ